MMGWVCGCWEYRFGDVCEWNRKTVQLSNGGAPVQCPISGRGRQSVSLRIGWAPHVKTLAVADRTYRQTPKLYPPTRMPIWLNGSVDGQWIGVHHCTGRSLWLCTGRLDGYRRCIHGLWLAKYLPVTFIYQMQWRYWWYNNESDLRAWPTSSTRMYGEPALFGSYAERWDRVRNVVWMCFKYTICWAFSAA